MLMIIIFKNKNYLKNEEKLWEKTFFYFFQPPAQTGFLGFSGSVRLFECLPTYLTDLRSLSLIHVCPSLHTKHSDSTELASIDGCRLLISDPYFVDSCYSFYVFCLCLILLYFNVCCRHRAKVLLFYCAMWILVPMEIWMCVFVKLLCVTTSVTTPAAALS